MFSFLIHLTRMFSICCAFFFCFFFLSIFHRHSVRTGKYPNCHLIQKYHHYFKTVNVILHKNLYSFFVVVISDLYATVKIRQNPISYLLIERSLNTISKILTTAFRNLSITPNWQPMCSSLNLYRLKCQLFIYFTR